MFEIVLLNNKTGERFTKYYDSYYFWQKALNKMKYSKKVQILSYGKAY